MKILEQAKVRGPPQTAETTITEMPDSLTPERPPLRVRSTDRIDYKPSRAIQSNTSPSSPRIYELKQRSADGRGLLGLSCLVLGSLALGFVFSGEVTGNEIVPLMVASGLGLLATSVSYSLAHEYQTSAVFAALSGFSVTYAFLQLGVTNNWFGIPIQDLTNVVSVYVVVWFTIISVICYATRAIANELIGILLALDVALAFVFSANILGSLWLLKWASAPMFAVALFSSVFLIKVVNNYRRRAVHGG